jgi:hypothetical protein
MSKHRLAVDRDEHHVSDLPPHVVRIPLPLPLPDLQVVNVYAILGDDGVTLVDSGWADEPSETVIVEALNRLGCTPTFSTCEHRASSSPCISRAPTTSRWISYASTAATSPHSSVKTSC